MTIFIASTITVDGQLTVAVSEDSPLPSALTYVGAGLPADRSERQRDERDLRNADNATAFYARDGGNVTLNDRQVRAWGGGNGK